MYGSFVQVPDGSISGYSPGKRVKNLGWLLRHWRDVERFEISSHQGQPEAVLRAYMRDGKRFVSGWASLDVLVNWLHRPVFFCTHVRIDGMDCVIRHRQGYVMEGPGWRHRDVASDST